MNLYVNFDEINEKFSFSKRGYLKSLYPDGCFERHEFKPFGKNCTLSVNHNSLVWGRFSEGRTGKGIISLYAYTHHNDNIREAGLALNNFLGLAGKSTPENVPQIEINKQEKVTLNQGEENERKRRFYYGLWNEATDTYNTLAMDYLKARGLIIETTKEMRYHPQILVRTEQNGKRVYCPCLLCPIINIENRFLGLFRTFLNADDPRDYKALRNENHPITHGKYKGLLGSPSGGAVKLGNPNSEIIILTEGIEDALSAYQTIDEEDRNNGIFSIPHGDYSVWAFLGTSHLHNLQIPENKKIILIVDNDEAGLKAEEKFRQRMNEEGRIYEAVLTKKYKDLNALHYQTQKKRGMIITHNHT